MIERDCFKKTWIDDKRSELQVADAVLLEKCIHAFELLGKLSGDGGFDFVFKGGTSLILLLNSDTELLSEESLLKLQSFFEKHPGVGIAGATLGTMFMQKRLNPQTVKKILAVILLIMAVKLFLKII